MKTYKLPEIRRIAKEQGYRFAALENAQGNRLVAYNTPTGKIDRKFDEIQKRLGSEVLPDGVYYVCLCTVHSRQSQADKLPVIKGNAKTTMNEHGMVIHQPTATPVKEIPEVLTYQGALQLQAQISKLESEATFATFINSQLQEKIDELEEELDEIKAKLQTYENPDGSPKKSPLAEAGDMLSTTLKDIVPQALPLFDRYFDIQEKRIAAGIDRHVYKDPKKKAPIQVASKEHLDLIDKLYNENREEELNRQLDILEKKYPVIYKKVIVHLGITDSEESEEGGTDE